MSQIANKKNVVNLALLALAVLSLIAIASDFKSATSDGIIVEPALVYAVASLEAGS